MATIEGNKKRITTKLKYYDNNKKVQSATYQKLSSVRKVIEISLSSECKIKWNKINLRVIYNEEQGFWNDFDFKPTDSKNSIFQKLAIITEKDLILDFA